MSKSINRGSTQRHSSSGGAATVAGKPVSKRWLVVLGIILIAFAGFVAWRSFQSTGSGSAVPLSDTTGTRLGEIAPDFTVPTLDGGDFTLTEQRGKPTIVFFMAYWCGTCIPEGRALARLQQEYGEDLNIIAIDLDPSSTPDALAQFKQASGNGDFTWAFDVGQQVTNAFQVQSLDTTLILDAEGHVVYRDAFPTPYETLKDALTDIGL